MEETATVKVSSEFSASIHPENATMSPSNEGFLHATGCATGNALSFSESLQEIHQLALNTSLSLDGCCHLETKLTRGMHISNQNMSPLSVPSVSSDNNASVPNIVQLSSLQRHGQPQQCQSSGSGKHNRHKFSTKGITSERTENMVSCRDCKDTVGLTAPGTELSLAIASVVDNGAEEEIGDSHTLISSMNINEQASTYCDIDKSTSRKDEMYLKLVQQVKELEVQLQERKEWAQQKALQAASKFSKDMAELKSLRLEHEEILRLKTDVQVDDGTTKRITEMESALRKASAQVDRANVNVRKLETENAELRAEMEAAKLSASESNAKFQEVVKREKKSSKKMQAWEKQKTKMLDELLRQKQQIVQVQGQLEELSREQQELEEKWRKEEAAKDAAIALANREKFSKEQLETTTKRKEEIWVQKMDADLQRHKDDMKRLEDELKQLKISSESRNKKLHSEVMLQHSAESNGLDLVEDSRYKILQDLAELQDSRGDVRRDWECVMCMSEESTVVFLPCAHQIVCVECNNLHQKQGMTDCPSCRTIIQERIRVFGARDM